jgi:hypothetical protein
MMLLFQRGGWLLLLVAGGCSGQASQAPQPAPPSGTPIEYAGWPSLTSEPVRVSEHLFAMCVETPEMKRLGPHFAPVVRYYANPDGLAAVSGGTAPVPVGTTVVKEKFWKDGEPVTGVAAMVKREAGYDPGFGDWEYVYSWRNPGGPWTTERGKLDNCRACHHGAKETDFLFRTYRQK